MIFIDTSFYFSLINQRDANHQSALKISQRYSNKQRFVTSWSIIGELLTVGSMYFDKKITIEFVNNIRQNKQMILILAKKISIDKTLKIFHQIQSKNISWVDCLSVALMEEHQIKQILTFDKDFITLKKITSNQFTIINS